jgi:hypothetical protein
MSTESYAYPYDETGSSPDNLIPAEQHTLTPSNGDYYQLVVPRNAPFYGNTMVVTHVDSGKVLIPGSDYIRTHQFMSATNAIEKEIYGSITLLNKSITGTLSLEYNCLGGPFIFDANHLLQELTVLMLYPDARTWEDITAIPQYFPPAQHEIHIEDLIGMDAVHDAIDELTEAVKGNGEGNHLHPIEHIRNLKTELRHRTKGSYNHKSSPAIGYTVLDHNGSIMVRLPTFTTATRVVLEVRLLNNGSHTDYIFSGLVKPGTTGTPGESWEHPRALILGNEVTKDVRLTYDANSEPVVYIGEATHWLDVHVTITSVTIDAAAPADFIDGWSVGIANNIVGELIPVAEKDPSEFQFDTSQTGSLKPWDIWLIDSNQSNVRGLPGLTAADIAPLVVGGGGTTSIPAEVHKDLWWDGTPEYIDLTAVPTFNPDVQAPFYGAYSVPMAGRGDVIAIEFRRDLSTEPEQDDGGAILIVPNPAQDPSTYSSDSLMLLPKGGAIRTMGANTPISYEGAPTDTHNVVGWVLSRVTKQLKVYGDGTLVATYQINESDTLWNNWDTTRVCLMAVAPNVMVFNGYAPDFLHDYGLPVESGPVASSFHIPTYATTPQYNDGEVVTTPPEANVIAFTEQLSSGVIVAEITMPLGQPPSGVYVFIIEPEYTDVSLGTSPTKPFMAISTLGIVYSTAEEVEQLGIVSGAVKVGVVIDPAISTITLISGDDGSTVSFPVSGNAEMANILANIDQYKLMFGTTEPTDVSITLDPANMTQEWVDGLFNASSGPGQTGPVISFDPDNYVTYDGPVQDGDEILVRDFNGRCYANPSQVVGSIHGEPAGLLVDRNNAWFKLKYSDYKKTWVVVEGNAGSRYGGGEGSSGVVVSEYPKWDSAFPYTDNSIITAMSGQINAVSVPLGASTDKFYVELDISLLSTEHSLSSPKIVIGKDVNNTLQAGLYPYLIINHDGSVLSYTDNLYGNTSAAQSYSKLGVMISKTYKTMLVVMDGQVVDMWDISNVPHLWTDWDDLRVQTTAIVSGTQYRISILPQNQSIDYSVADGLFNGTYPQMQVQA